MSSCDWSRIPASVTESLARGLHATDHQGCCKGSPCSLPQHFARTKTEKLLLLLLFFDSLWVSASVSAKMASKQTYSHKRYTHESIRYRIGSVSLCQKQHTQYAQGLLAEHSVSSGWPSVCRCSWAMLATLPYINTTTRLLYLVLNNEHMHVPIKWLTSVANTRS